MKPSAISHQRSTRKRRSAGETSIVNHQSKIRRGFSLVEMLFAIFILGLGVISIASLFPVGLTQQQRSADAIIGPTIANNALEVIRGKVKADDFGWFDNLGNIYLPPPQNPGTGIATDFRYPSGSGFAPGLQGDWSWRRPAFYIGNGALDQDQDQFGNTRNISAGSINLFEGLNIGTSAADTNTEIPFNSVKYFNGLISAPPRIIITQEERYFPQRSTEMYANNNGYVEPPQYIWDCAFRRFEGKIQVAIFVYRAQVTGGEAAAFHANDFANRPPGITGDEPLLPHFNLLDGNAGSADDPWPDNPSGGGYSEDDAFILNTDPGDPVDLRAFDDGWQGPGEWMLDQYGAIHRVMSGRRNGEDGPVQLVRPVRELHYTRPAYPIHFDEGVAVWELWYIPPVVIDQFEREWRLTPVYLAVREL
jgi:prepilin-type N-terminal cleavage/methylation domain-containing protein